MTEDGQSGPKSTAKARGARANKERTTGGQDTFYKGMIFRPTRPMKIK
jgi:hypothetical protein